MLKTLSRGMGWPGVWMSRGKKEDSVPAGASQPGRGQKDGARPCSPVAVSRNFSVKRGRWSGALELLCEPTALRSISRCSRRVVVTPRLKRHCLQPEASSDLMRVMASSMGFEENMWSLLTPLGSRSVSSERVFHVSKKRLLRGTRSGSRQPV